MTSNAILNIHGIHASISKSLSFHAKSEKSYTSRQKKYVDTLNDNTIQLIISHGPAGTGKSWLACKHALEQLKNNKIKKLYLRDPSFLLMEKN